MADQETSTRTKDLAHLNGRIALVTGAGDVGACLARSLAQHGAGAVAVVDLDGARAEAAVAEIEEEGVRGLAIEADLTAPGAPAEIRRRAETLGGPVDILVHNAGIPPNYFSSGRGLRPFLETQPDDWAPLLKLNLEAVLALSHEIVPPMIERGWGRVIAIVSDAARTGDRNMAVYAAAKGGTAAFMRSLASEVGRSGVTANCVSLGTIWRAEEAPTEEDLRRAARDYPLARYGSREDVASMVTFLASDAAGWITGQVYGVDGGYTYGL
jgi:2-hydroxycyclohexanecarboxyl-CoA dehydrogenase